MSSRAVGQLLSERWGQPVVVENRAGAGGVVGTDLVAKSAPDGYTLLVTYAGSQAINQSLYPKIPFDCVKDFQTVATLASTPFLLIGTKLPAKDLAEFIALARKKPDASPTPPPATARSIICSARCSSEAGIKMLHVPYRGVAPHHRRHRRPGRCGVPSVPSVLQIVQQRQGARPCREQRQAHRGGAGGPDHRRIRAFRASTSIRGGAFWRRPAPTWRSCARSIEDVNRYLAHEGDDRTLRRKGPSR